MGQNSDESTSLGYLREPEKWCQVVQILDSHQLEVREHYLCHLKPRMSLGGDSRERLTELSAIANHQRRGVDRENQKVKK